MTGPGLMIKAMTSQTYPNARSFWMLGSAVFLGLGAFTPQALEATDFSAKMAALGQGDDRFFPAFAAGFGYESLNGQLLYSRIAFKPVELSTYLLTITYRRALSKFKNLSIDTGFALLLESARINPSGFAPTVPTTNKSDAGKTDTEGNLGGVFALTYRRSLGARLYLEGSWQNSLFGAGLEGMILLVTGRKQVISLALGADLP